MNELLCCLETPFSYLPPNTLLYLSLSSDKFSSKLTAKLACCMSHHPHLMRMVTLHHLLLLQLMLAQIHPLFLTLLDVSRHCLDPDWLCACVCR